MTIVAYVFQAHLEETWVSAEIWGLEVDQVYVDRGDRQQLAALWQRLETHPPEYLLVRRLEELGDRLAEVQQNLHQLEALGVQVIATEQPYSTHQFQQLPPGELRGKLGALWQEISDNLRKQALARGHGHQRLRHLPPPGKAPYGYRRGQDRYLLDRSTAPMVKDFCDRFLLFGSLRGAVRYLEQKYGKKIAVSTGKKWLTSPVYRGSLVYKTGAVIPHCHQGIISPEEGAQIDRLLRRNRRFSPRSASAPRSLAGLVHCDRCGQPLQIVSVKSKKNPDKTYGYLRNPRCPQTPSCGSVNYDRCLTQIITQICRELPPAVGLRGRDGDGPSAIAQGLRTEIQTQKTILAQLVQLERQGILDSHTQQWRSHQIQQTLGQLENRLAQLPPPNLQNIAQAISLPQFWQDLSESERRFYFREFLQRIDWIRDDHGGDRFRLVFIFDDFPRSVTGP